ncbi:Macrolide export protein MacA [Pirellula sp. SH-Sr6A]|uniref:HlyD family secretion protein n=1 Tax=Pirellula sp. SH-Sr6A TaxID=1632865 RepID=UPI00078B8D4B|nr:HlyD family efflux transporter periplasmic adaptor subunit [Pirellula sp. SH-Sr6A]AMV34606.1 Macrolide export protein MacA [Pirellula sp. SH-Sr6A]
MNRSLTSLFAIASVVLAGVLLVFAISFIRKNTPREQETAVKRTPPTAPNVQSVASRPSDYPSNANFIGGVGIVEPVGEATTIGSQLPGVVEEVCVQPGHSVKQGDALIRLDRRSAIADVAVAKAELVSQQARLAELQGNIPTLEARYRAAIAIHEQAEAALRNAEKDFERVRSVQGTFALSEEEIDTRRLNLETAKGKIAETEARRLEAKANLDLLAGPQAPSIEVQKIAVVQAEANLQRAQTNLDLRTIVAPKDGTVLSVRLRVGEFVPASILSTPFISLGVIDPLHVRVDIDEAEIPRFSAGAKAYASLRGKPGTKVPLQYVRTEPLVVPKRTLTGTVSERVDTRVLQVIYSAKPDELKASVGQQVDVYIEGKID